jgi:hypothetical protein
MPGCALLPPSSPPPQDLAGTLDETLNTAGAVIVQLATNAATAMQSAQRSMEGVMPVPTLQQILTNLR